MLSRLGYKKTIFIGILAWAARYFLLAGSVDSVSMQTMMVFSAILLHGVCYDFLFIAGQLYVDEEANERMRGAAQGLIAFILWGVGAFVGNSIWIYPAWGSVAVLVAFMIFFREPKKVVKLETDKTNHS
jgi:MFS family permease